MSEVKYIPIGNNIKIAVPVDLSQQEIDERVAKYRNNLENGKKQHYNPKKRTYLKSKF